MRRRPVGVSHALARQQRDAQLSTLGASLTAERIADVHAELDRLAARLRALAEAHRPALAADPTARARVRRLAEALGVDVHGGSGGGRRGAKGGGLGGNIFASLKWGDVTHGLAARVVGACIEERRFVGAWVRVDAVVRKLNREDEAGWTAEDVTKALGSLKVLGAGYGVVEWGGVAYIQTVPSKGFADEVEVTTVVVKRAQEKSGMTAISSSRPPSVRFAELCRLMPSWSPPRVWEAVRRLLTNGDVWIEFDEDFVIAGGDELACVKEGILWWVGVGWGTSE